MFGVDIFDIGYSKVENYTPARKYLFDVFFPDITGQLLAAESASFPLPTFEVIGRSYINQETFVVGKKEVPQMTIDFYENELGLATDYFSVWMQAKTPKDISSVYDPMGYAQYPVYYKKDLYALFRASRGWPYMAIKYEGCFPISISPYSMDMSAAEVLTVSVTFSVDFISVIGLTDALSDDPIAIGLVTAGAAGAMSAPTRVTSDGNNASDFVLS